MTMPLRLLLVTDAVGGVWVYSLELARALKATGIETVLAIMGPSPSASQREQARGFKLIDTGLPLDWLATGPGEVFKSFGAGGRAGMPRGQQHQHAEGRGVHDSISGQIKQHAAQGVILHFQ